jgi:hypothetical protein
MPKKMTGKKPQATLAPSMEEPKEGRPTKFKPEMAEQARKLWRDKTEHGVTDREGNDVPLTAMDMARRAAFLFAQAEAEANTLQ